MVKMVKNGKKLVKNGKSVKKWYNLKLFKSD